MKKLFLALLALAGSGPLLAQPSAQVDFTSSNLPIVVIDTHGAQIVDDPKVGATMGIIDNGPGRRNQLTDPFNGYKGAIGIEFRGSSSQTFPKKSFGVETWDADGDDKDTVLLGMPAESDWVLTANYSDKTLMRNQMTYDLGRSMGHYTSRSHYCEVVLNGVYQGVYVLGEKIKRDKNRVDIAKLDKDEVTGKDLTGGYLVKIDKSTGDAAATWPSKYISPDDAGENNIFFQLDYPKLDDVQPAQLRYIEAYVDSFETALAGPNYRDAATGYRRYINPASFIDYMLLTELSRNIDGYRYSTYFYKDKEDKLTMGPLWDYDIAWHNSNYCNGEAVEGWIYENHEPCLGRPFWWRRLMTDPTFAGEVGTRWRALRQTLLSEQSLTQYLDSTAAQLDESQQRNFQAWPIIGEYVWPNPLPIAATYQGEVRNLKEWMYARLTWLDANLPPAAVTGTKTPQLFAQTTAYPNPFDASLTVELHLTKPTLVQLELLDLTGRQVATYQPGILPAGRSQQTLPGLANSSNGIYLLRISSPDATRTIRVVHQRK